MPDESSPTFLDRTLRSFRRAWRGTGTGRGALKDGVAPDLPDADARRVQLQIDACLEARGGVVSARARAAELGEAYLALRDAETLDVDPQIDLALGAACMRLNLPIEAEKFLSEALVQLPDDLQLQLDLCKTRIQIDDWDGAREALRDARSINPSHPQIDALEQELVQAEGS